MRIVFDVSSCAKPQRKGIANYGAELVRHCAAVAPEHELVLAVRSHRWSKRKYVQDLLSGTRVRLLVDGLERWTLGRPVDVLQGIGVRLPGTDRFPKVVTLHDVNVFEFPELSTPEWRETRRRRIRQTVERARLVLAMSSQGARAITKHVGVAPARIRVVPEGVDLTRFRRPAPEVINRVTAAHGLDGTPYIICVGTDDLRKNHAGLLEAFAHAKLPDEWKLVLCGPRGDSAHALHARAKQLGLAQRRLVIPGWIEEEDLPPLLSGAAIYACGSLHEGFGLPVLEAQACGVAVASSNRGALPETLGDCGLLFDPTNLDDFAGALQQLAGNEMLRDELAVRGPLRVAEEFSWERVARRTLDVLEEAAGMGARVSARG